MKLVLGVVSLVCGMILSHGGRSAADQDRLRRSVFRAGRRVRRGHVQLLHASDRAQWRQAWRRSSPGHPQGQPDQARGREPGDRRTAQPGQCRDHHRRHVLERDDGDLQEGHRQRHLFDRIERQPLAACRRAVLAVLFQHQRPERSARRSGRQIRHREGLQARLHHGAELSGREGLHRRLQAPLQAAAGR